MDWVLEQDGVRECYRRLLAAWREAARQYERETAR
jgi:hypothetical protein